MQNNTKPTHRKANWKMTLRFALVAIVLAAARILIPTQAFASLPVFVTYALEAAPYLVAAVIVLNLSLPRKAIPAWGYAVAVLLLVPSVLGYGTVFEYLSETFPKITATLDIWSLEAIPLYALRPAALGLTLLMLFVLMWKVSFATFPWHKLRLRRLIRPGQLLIFLTGCLVVAYFHMVNYAQINASPVYGMLFALGPPKEAVWYHLGPIPNLVIHWTAQPLEALLMCYPLRTGMLMIAESYPPRMAPASPENKPEAALADKNC